MQYALNKIIPLQDFCPMKIKITQCPGGFHLKLSYFANAFVNRVRLDRRVKLLVDALIDELDCSRSFLLHVGPRATRRAVSLLVRLGRAAEVCLVCLLHRGQGQKERITMSLLGHFPKVRTGWPVLTNGKLP